MVKKDDPLYIDRDENVWFCTKCTESIFPFYNIYDEVDFISCISENFTDKKYCLSKSSLDHSSLFSPFELNIDDESPLTDVDPDVQFYQNHCNDMLHSCDYYVEDTFCKRLEELSNYQDNCLSMIHLNIRSANRNLDSFSNFLQGINHTFPLIGLTETWLKPENINLCGIDSYIGEHNCRTERIGGIVYLCQREYRIFCP